MISGRTPRVIGVNIYEDARAAPIWMQVLFSIWLAVYFLPLPEFSFVRYGCMIALLGIVVMQRHEVLPLLIKAWPLFPLPVLAALSIFWTPYPDGALTTVVLLLLTPFWLVVIASQIRATEFLRLMAISGWLAVLYSVPYYGTLAEGGPFPQKNMFAFHMVLVMLLSMGVLLNDKEHGPIRLIAAVFVPVAFLFQLLAVSATSLVFAVVGSALLVAIKLVWSPASSVRHMRTVLLAGFAVAALAVAILVLSIPNNSLVQEFLGLVGKDTSLTGRTQIWQAAEMVSAEHPWFGVGVEGFWNYNTGLAQTLNENDHKAYGTKLSFHSSFWEVRVHFGLVGLGFFLFAMAWSGLRLIRMWLQDGSVTNSTLLLMYALIVISSFTESYSAGTTNPMVYLLYFGGLAAFGLRERRFVGVGRLVERPT